MERRTRRSYSQEFKKEAVKLITQKGYTIAEASRNLGVEYSVLRRWKHQLEQELKDVLTGEARQTKSPEEEIRRLKAELERITEERDVLKKALVYFAKPQK